MAENPLEDNRQCIKTEEILKLKDLQLPISIKLSISKSQCLNNFKTVSSESTKIGTHKYESQKQETDHVITTNIEVGYIQCDQCPFIAKTKIGLKLHVTTIYKPSSYCKICNQLLPKYHKHCKLCTFVAEQKSKLREHVKSDHPKNTPPQYNIGHKIFKSKGSLWDHKLIHLGIKYDCAKCP